MERDEGAIRKSIGRTEPSIYCGRPVLETISVTEEEKQTALARALDSRLFARSEQLRAFLKFVCEAEIRGAGRELNEYLIGVEVLGRAPGYSPAEDSSVRTRAYELRSKLKKLYSGELAEDAIHIVIPKGTYSPQYLRLHTASAHVEPAPLSAIHAPGIGQEVAQPARAAHQLWRVLLFCLVLAVLSGAAGAYLALHYSAAAREVDPVLAEAWSAVGRKDSNVLFSVATPLHLVVGPDTHGIFGSSTYPAPPEAYALFRQHRPLSGDARLGMAFTDNALGMGTMNAVLIAANTVRKLGATHEILPERVATLSALRGRNAVLFGAPVDSEAIARTLQTTPLTVEYDASVREFVILDRATGRTLVPKKENGDFTTVYGLVTVLNTRESDRGRLGMIVFSGITSAGTHGAAEYFASAGALSKLRDVFKAEGINGFPPAYQVVVRCNFSNMLLLSSSYDSHRIIKEEKD